MRLKVTAPFSLMWYRSWRPVWPARYRSSVLSRQHRLRCSNARAPAATFSAGARPPAWTAV